MRKDIAPQHAVRAGIEGSRGNPPVESFFIAIRAAHRRSKNIEDRHGLYRLGKAVLGVPSDLEDGLRLAGPESILAGRDGDERIGSRACKSPVTRVP